MCLGGNRKMENIEVTFYLDPVAHKNLQKDLKLFQMKPKESVLIKRIIVNHHSKYNQKIKELHDTIKDSFKDQASEPLVEDAVWHITRYISENSIDKSISTKEKRIKDKIHLRVNNNESLLENILEECPSSISKSEFIANIIYSYLDNPQYERERIIFKEELKKLETAIKNNQAIKIKSKYDRSHNNNFQIIYPKEVCFSNEELFNYLLYKKVIKGKEYARSIHLYNIDTIFLLPENCTFSEEILNRFKRMKRNGVQFTINHNTEFKIQFTEDGLKRYNNLNYLEKPVALDKSDEETRIFYFDCSDMQFKNYFANFYDEMEVLEPKKMREHLLRLGQRMVDKYSKDI